ncbi:MAG: cytochrome b/b6 domain-containing protein [Panacagrimonas sp.]
MSDLKSYPVWDAVTRWVHWINVLCVIALAALGLAILNAGAFEIPNEGKVLLKTLHVWVGYVFAINIGVRIVRAFVGNHYARWRQMLPVGSGYLARVRSYAKSFAAGRPEQYLGHNPLGRMAVAVLLLLITVQALTGLVLAGTDIYFPPFGHWIAQWIAAPGVDPATLVPYSPELYDKASYADMRAMRAPVATLHLYGFFVLAAMIVLHIVAVVVTELREGGNLVSAMFSGRKIVAGQPVDAPGPADGQAAERSP